MHRLGRCAKFRILRKRHTKVPKNKSSFPFVSHSRHLQWREKNASDMVFKMQMWHGNVFFFHPSTHTVQPVATGVRGCHPSDSRAVFTPTSDSILSSYWETYRLPQDRQNCRKCQEDFACDAQECQPVTTGVCSHAGSGRTPGHTIYYHSYIHQSVYRLQPQNELD